MGIFMGIFMGMLKRKAAALCLACLAGLAGLLAAVPARGAGTIVLTGANLYDAHGSTGATDDFGYRLTTNSYDITVGPAASVTITDTTVGSTASGNSAISMPLVDGANTFTFSPSGSFPLNDGGDGLNLFFAASGTYNPTTGTIPGDLTVAAAVGGSSFVVPALNTTIERYDFGGGGGPSVGNWGTQANGNTSYGVGDKTVTVSAFHVISNNTGTFTLVVTPEPASLALLSFGAVGLLVRRRTRTRQR